MVDGRVRTITSHLRRYDPDLYADRATDGIITVYRKYRTYIPYSYEGKNLYVSTIVPQWIMALTRDWSANTQAIDWGIEPLLSKIKTMDQWRKDSALDESRRHNEMAAKIKERSFRNNVRALAADVRRDFAKATNDINTASMAKKSNRRK